MNAKEGDTALSHAAALVQGGLGHQGCRDPVKQEPAVPGDLSDFICHGVWDRKGRMWLSGACSYARKSLCSMVTENQLHGDILADVLLCLCATTDAASYLDAWLRRESKGEAGPWGTKLAVKAVALLGSV